MKRLVAVLNIAFTTLAILKIRARVILVFRTTVALFLSLLLTLLFLLLLELYLVTFLDLKSLKEVIKIRRLIRLRGADLVVLFLKDIIVAREAIEEVRGELFIDYIIYNLLEIGLDLIVLINELSYRLKVLKLKLRGFYK